MTHLTRHSRLPLFAGLILSLAGCVNTPGPQRQATPAPVYPGRDRIAAGQVIDLSRNEPMGLFGTRAVMAEAPACSMVRMSDGQPVRLGERLVAPVLAPSSTACPPRNPRNNAEYVTLNRAVLLNDGLFADSPTTECFLPNSGGGHCRPVGQ